MTPEPIVEKVEKLLRSHGLQYAFSESPRDACFNVVAKGGGVSLIMRALEDLSEARRSQVEELCAISDWVAATPLIVAERMGDEELDDDAVYLRDGVYAVSPGALERSLEGDPPLVEVSTVGCFVYINGELVRRRREELGLSVGELARLAGVSRMTIYSYERGRRRTTPSIAYRLEYVLGVPIVIPMNPLAPRPSERYSAPAAKVLVKGLPRKGLLRMVFRLLRRLKLMIMAFFNAPFEVMARYGDFKMAVNVVHGRDYDDTRIRATREFAEVMDLNHLVVGPEGYECPHDVQSICVGELRNMRDPRELADLFT
ncbi:hypothetical protein DRO32_04950 [Candidatus Bathyarchaeota archaeon]|nr:MAG: hypothetical protein DRO32_04950 [Candidatus Bathyarchaeota archaeon]